MILGIDPGASGGLAIVAQNDLEIPTQAVSMKDMTEGDLWFFFLEQKSILDHAFIERVHTMPKQGIVSAGKFMQNYGFLRGMLVASGIPWEEVTPQTWQRSMSCLSKGDKNVTKAKAQQLFPQIKVTHATADALLIAEYGRRKLLGTRCP